jgi:hypothetical protein
MPQAGTRPLVTQPPTPRSLPTDRRTATASLATFNNTKTRRRKNACFCLYNYYCPSFLEIYLVPNTFITRLNCKRKQPWPPSSRTIPTRHGFRPHGRPRDPPPRKSTKPTRADWQFAPSQAPASTVHQTSYLIMASPSLSQNLKRALWSTSCTCCSARDGRISPCRRGLSSQARIILVYPPLQLRTLPLRLMMQLPGLCRPSRPRAASNGYKD